MFDYILEKITEARFSEYPYKHLLIDDFLSEEHLDLIINDNQIKRPAHHTTRELVDDLQNNGWKIISNAGCRVSVEDYLACLENDEWPDDGKEQSDLLQRYGLTFSLKECNCDILNQLTVFTNSDEFGNCLKRKFGIDENIKTNIETGIRKYLTGYEISPHPDIRKKCLTYMLNINTDARAEHEQIHTHVLRFKKEFEYIYKSWENSTSIERCWVPWHWAETVSTVSKNNSIIIFNPSYNTLHGVKLDYNHLEFQRTQLYGNFWYDGNIRYEYGTWENLI